MPMKINRGMRGTWTLRVLALIAFTNLMLPLQLNAQLLEQRILKEIEDNPVLELSEEPLLEDVNTEDEGKTDEMKDN